jgi:hypothetical protein
MVSSKSLELLDSAAPDDLIRVKTAFHLNDRGKIFQLTSHSRRHGQTRRWQIASIDLNKQAGTPISACFVGWIVGRHFPDIEMTNEILAFDNDRRHVGYGSGYQ